jgi:hypothetical protein
MNFKILPVICISALGFFSSCGKDDDSAPATPTPTNNDPITNPTNTTVFKAIIAGSNWQATNHNTVSSGGLFQLHGQDNAGRKITISTGEITKTGTYTSGSLAYELTHSDGSYSRWTGFLNDSTINVLTVTSFDATTKKMSGTFKFSGAKVFGATTEPDTIKVTNGEFTGIKLP